MSLHSLTATASGDANDSPEHVQPSEYDDRISFSSGEVASFIGKNQKTSNEYIDDKGLSFRINRDRRCTRKGVESLVKQIGIEINLGHLSEEFFENRRRILHLEKLSAENIADLLQVAPQVVRGWMNNGHLPYTETAPKKRHVSWFNLFRFLQDQKIPYELLYGYHAGKQSSKPTKMQRRKPATATYVYCGPQTFSEAEVVALFAQHLCDDDDDRARKKFDVLIETGGLTHLEDGENPEFSSGDVMTYLREHGCDVHTIPSSFSCAADTPATPAS